MQHNIGIEVTGHPVLCIFHSLSPYPDCEPFSDWTGLCIDVTFFLNCRHSRNLNQSIYCNCSPDPGGDRGEERRPALQDAQDHRLRAGAGDQQHDADVGRRDLRLDGARGHQDLNLLQGQRRLEVRAQCRDQCKDTGSVLFALVSSQKMLHLGL